MNLKYRIRTATITDLPAIMSMQKKAFLPVAKKIGWMEIPQMVNTLEDNIPDFETNTILVMLSDEDTIIGSIRGYVENGSLYIGRLMVDPDYQKRGLGRILMRELESRFQFNREWLCSYIDDTETYTFYQRDGFVTYEIYEVGNGVMAAHMEKLHK